LTFLLRYYLSTFGHAVSLFDHCDVLNRVYWAEAGGKELTEEQERKIANTVHWVHVAARDAVMTVYHFGVTLDALRQNARRAPSLKGVDGVLLKSAWKHFLKRFPHYERHRHAVSHVADDMRTHEKLEALTPDDGNIIAGQIIGREYIVRYRGRDMRLAVTSETHDELEAIMTEAWDAFRPIKEAELEAARQRDPRSNRPSITRRSSDPHGSR
jgi:hypothetical protein